MEETKEGPVVDNTVGKLKVKKKMKKIKSNPEGDVAKVDLKKPIEPKQDEVKEDNPVDEGVVTELSDADTTEKQEEVQPEVEAQEAPVLEEVTEEEVKEVAEEIAEEIIEAKETGKAIPENLQKVVDFMEETGGTLEDYVKLNQDFTGYEDKELLREYYKTTKSHLNQDEVDFLINEEFSYDEEIDEDKDIKRKKIALKEQVARAKSHLDGQKSKYYEEIKAGSRLTPEAQKAMDFFNRYNKQEEESRKVADSQTTTFVNKTNQVFNDTFKGFEYKVGDKRYRVNVKNGDEVKKTQSDLNNFTKKFLDKNNMMSDAMGYHKSLFTAMNSDAIANHFYEQGKADALKDSVAKSKNINMDPRESMPANNNTSGPKFRVIDDSTSSYGFKKRK
jgi:hypothetical protein